MITEAFHYLDQWAAIEQLIREYYDASQSAIVPAPLILNTLRPIREMWETYTFSRDLNGDISGLVTRVIQNTTKPFNVSAALEGGAFHTLFTGDSTRLEILGILYGIAGLASLFGLATNRFAGLERSSRAGFAQKMLEATDVILQVCKMVTPVNDLTVWMLYENLLLTTLVLGDSSK